MARPQQEPLEPRTRGGRREGAGRKPNIPGKPLLRHEARPTADPQFPVHVTMRVCSGVPRLRQLELWEVLCRAFVYGCKQDEFRICQFSIQNNHIHLVCEAHTAEARASGIQGFAVRVARGINRVCGRRGRVFEDRYHLEVLTTPAQVRDALCYVLQNARRHRVQLDPRWHGADPFSSAWWFDGWQDANWKLGLDPPPMRTVAEPESWLLRIGWQRAKAGRLAIDEVPAARTKVTGGSSGRGATT